MFRILYSNRVIEVDMPFLPKAIHGRVAQAIQEKLTHDPVRFGKALRHSWRGHRRLRVGDYRIVYRIDSTAKIVYIVAIDHRKDVYD
ncbi:MAG: type II toxin-antitoxin system RelE family toxin [Alphaproteobacteria bacterium]|jgi:mRNA interferase RelE/StbE